MKKWTMAALVLAAVVGTGCGKKKAGGDNGTSAMAAEKTTAAATTAGDQPQGLFAATAPGAGGHGKDRFQKERATTAEFKAFEPLFDRPFFPKVATLLSEVLKFPRDMQMVAKECKALNAWYQKSTHSITLCYDLASYFYKS